MDTDRFKRDYEWCYARGIIIIIGFKWNMTVRSSQDDEFDIIWDSIYFVTIYPIKFGKWVVWKWAIYMCTCILYKTETVHYTVTLNMYEVTDQTKICMHLPDWLKRTYNESLARIKIKVWKYSGNFTINEKKISVVTVIRTVYVPSKPEANTLCTEPHTPLHSVVWKAHYNPHASYR